MKDLDNDFLEKAMIKAALEDKHYGFLIGTKFEKRYFDDPILGEVFDIIKNHGADYSAIPTRDIILANFKKEKVEKVRDRFHEIDSIDIDLPHQYDYVLRNSNIWLRNKSVAYVIMDNLPLIEKGEVTFKLGEEIQEALSKDLTIDLGLDYIGELIERIKRTKEAMLDRLSTGFASLDDFTNGGLPPYTLNIFAAKIHGFKSNIMANMASRQVMMGKKVALLTLEMSEDAFAQRFDSIYTSLDINRIYLHNDVHSIFKEKIGKVVTDIIKKKGRLFIKQFPPGTSSVGDYRVYIRELLIRDIIPDVIYVDYINLMKPGHGYRGKGGSDLYSDVKRIAEELRALSFEFKIPVVSVSQLNREGMAIDLSALDFNFISESVGLPATADFMAIVGIDDEKLIYENEVHYKLVKNRLGGRVGEIGRMFFDARSLKMYDSSEEELWREDASFTGDERIMAEED